MKTTRTIAAALGVLALLAGCGGDDAPTLSGTTVPGGGTATTVAATTTTVSAAAIKAALLQSGDVPGSTASPSSGGDADVSACFPGNPLGAKTDPNEVDSPDLEIKQAAVERSYSSSARVATADQAKSFVTTAGTAAGSKCIVDTFKAFLSAPPDPVDASGITGKGSTVTVGDAGSLIAITGTVKSGTQSARVGLDLLVFHKGSVVVFLSAGANNGSVVEGQALELAKKMAGRLP